MDGVECVHMLDVAEKGYLFKELTKINPHISRIIKNVFCGEFLYSVFAKNAFRASLRLNLLAPPAKSGSFLCTGSSSQPQTGQISYSPLSSSTRLSQQGQGKLFLFISDTFLYKILPLLYHI